MVQQLSALDIGLVLQEIQFLQHSRIEKFRFHGHFFTIEVYVPTVGKHYLYVQTPKLLFFSTQKPESENTNTGFLGHLRTVLQGKTIDSITQESFDRIVYISCTDKKETVTLVIELFGQGNLLVLDDKSKILAVDQAKKYSATRQLLPGRTYVPPSQTKHPSSYTQDDVKKLCFSSDRPTIGHVLAMDIGLGGQYAKEVLHKAKIEDKGPKALTTGEYEAIHTALQELFTLPISSFTKNERAYPFTSGAIDISEALQHPSFNVALGSLFSEEKPKQENPRKKNILKIIAKQEQQLKQVLESSASYQEQGEFVYTNYLLITQILDDVKKHNALHPETKSRCDQAELQVQIQQGKVTISNE
jgi:predicted ribosome quality control (RQC) complex YloA/Tae2 family protein